MIKVICKQCKMGFKTWACRIKIGEGKFCSRKCRAEYMKGKPSGRKGTKLPQNSGENNCNWKGNNAGYVAIHIWLKLNYGKANHCENPECEGVSKNYEWALLKGKTYQHNRNNFIMLCIPCHHKYDMTDKLRNKISETLKGRKLSEQHRKNIGKGHKGLKYKLIKEL